VFAGSALALASQFRSNPWTTPVHHADSARPGFVSGYRMLLASPWTRFVLLSVFIEAGIFFGGFTYVAADLHGRFGLSFSVAGIVIAGYGVGSVLYAMSVHRLVEFGERGLVLGGGIAVALGFVALAAVPYWELAPLACTLLGLGYYMVHNTLQTNATQMLPQSRATAVAAFSSMLFLGQSAGVALAAPIVDRAGAVPVFISAAVLWPALAWWIRVKLKSREIC
jgi:predicted MFS family arabinose efflux permease